MLENDPGQAAVCKQGKKALGYLETNLRHPSLKNHEFSSWTGRSGEKVFEAYAQNNTSGAYRIFWHYGPDDVVVKKKTAGVTIVAITLHP
ncbi:MAG: hypothetical protein EXS43_00220 [Opitutus sp.]|nr:hypothetical protein [Opitutus sp.]